MPKNFYIADLHFGHRAVLKYDNRPFSSVEEGDAALIDNWNSVVGLDDSVYILGDVGYHNVITMIDILKQLNGRKYLIKGNHDIKLCRNKDFQKQFLSIDDYLEVAEGEAQIVLCHYPILAYRNHYYSNNYHFYGHVHNTWEEEVMRQVADIMAENHQRFKAYNVGCMMPYMNYTPRTFEEIREEGDKWYSKTQK